MKINWKAVAASPGYISMKAAIAADANRWGRPDKRYQEAFDFAINRAKHLIYSPIYSKTRDYTLQLIMQLHAWEVDRKQNFINYYSGYNLSKKKKHSNVLKPGGIRQRIKFYKGNTQHKNSHRAAKEMIEYLQKKRTKKARWTPEYKTRIHRFR